MENAELFTRRRVAATADETQGNMDAIRQPGPLLCPGNRERRAQREQPDEYRGLPPLRPGLFRPIASQPPAGVLDQVVLYRKPVRSEERRVGKEWRSPWS